MCESSTVEVVCSAAEVRAQFAYLDPFPSAASPPHWPRRRVPRDGPDQLGFIG